MNEAEYQHLLKISYEKQRQHVQEVIFLIKNFEYKSNVY